MKIRFLLSLLWAASSEGRGCEYFEAVRTKSVSLVLLCIFMQGLYTQPPHTKAPRVPDFASHPRDFHLSLVLVKGVYHNWLTGLGAKIFSISTSFVGRLGGEQRKHIDCYTTLLAAAYVQGRPAAHTQTVQTTLLRQVAESSELYLTRFTSLVRCQVRHNTFVRAHFDYDSSA
jgi:hypothetical protein